MDIFGEGGGKVVAERLSVLLGHEVPLMATIPLDPSLRAAGDEGTPIVIKAPESPATQAINSVAESIAVRSDSLVGKKLGLDVTRKG